MTNYRRFYKPGGTYFFTVVTWNRQPLLASEQAIDRLRQSFIRVRRKHAFRVDAIVILPDHLHTVWQLPDDDADYSTRWSMIKHDFSIALASVAGSVSRQRRREKCIWQRRFWEHAIRSREDWRRHIDYIHFNPVRHGHAASPAEWRYSSFGNALRRGWYDENWGRVEPETIRNLWLE